MFRTIIRNNRPIIYNRQFMRQYYNYGRDFDNNNILTYFAITSMSTFTYGILSNKGVPISIIGGIVAPILLSVYVPVFSILCFIDIFRR